MAEKGILERYVAAFAEMRNPRMDGTNPHFRNKFASLLSTSDAVRAALVKHGLAYRQTPEPDEGGRVWMVTYLMGAEGQMELARWPLETAKKDGTPYTPQEMGSAGTYSKRYCLQAAFGIVGDEDDDAEAASHQSQSKPRKAPKAPSAQSRPQRAADGPTDAEKAELAEIAAAYGDKRDVWNAYQANGMEGARALLAMVAPAPQMELADSDIEFGAAS